MTCMYITWVGLKLGWEGTLEWALAFCNPLGPYPKN